MQQHVEQTIVPNEVYNVLKALSTKLEGLATYNKYEQDQTNAQLWQQLRQQDEQAVRQLLQQLERLAQDGKLKAREPQEPLGGGKAASLLTLPGSLDRAPSLSRTWGRASSSITAAEVCRPTAVRRRVPSSDP